MLLFWLLAALLVAAVLGALLGPLLRTRNASEAPDAAVASLAVYRDQKRALDAEVTVGTMTTAEHEAAITELSQRLAEETATAAVPAAVLPRRAWMLALVLAVCIPLMSVTLYYRLGNPLSLTIAAPGSGKHDLSEPQVAAMVESLAQRLKQHPDDAEGWALLARSYQALERFADAADAYAHANGLVQDDPGLLVDYADALAMAQGKSLAGKPAALVQRALAIDPENRKALALAATGALEAHDPQGSLVYWRRLAATLPPGSEEAGQIDAFIAQISQAQGSSAPAAASAAPEQPAAAPRRTAPVAGSLMPPESIAGRVEVSPTLAAKVAPSDTVFIFARALDGPRMPLAVLRISARDLPTDFILDDSSSMAPNAKLSGAPQVVVEARISKQGTAISQPGDLFGRLASVKPGTKGLRIIIDQIVP